MSFSPLQPNPDWVRRDVLKGLSLGAGATLLAPLIQQAVALAEGKSDGVQRRVVFVLQSNGLRPSFITPSGHVWKESREGGTTGGELVELSLRDRALPAALEPLTPLKDRITLLQGLSGRIALERDTPHAASVAWIIDRLVTPGQASAPLPDIGRPEVDDLTITQHNLEDYDAL